MKKDTTNKNFWQKFAKIYTAFMAKNDVAYDGICDSLEKYIDEEKSVFFSHRDPEMVAEISAYRLDI